MNTTCDRFAQAFRLNEICSACLCFMLGSAPALAQQSGATSVGNFQVQAGSATVAPGADPKQVLINLSNSKSVLQWDRLNVPDGSKLQFAQPNAQSIVLNRVVSVDPARIDGALSSNGQVWILSGAGVLFGPNSKVDVQSLLASSRDISNADFLAGKYSFGAGGSGKVSNQGELTVADGGYVLLVGSEVDNQGRIQAQLGQVKLASGKAFVLDLNGDKLLRFDVTEALTGGDSQAAKVSNAGQIIADGGSVQMTARAASGLVAQVVNTGGLVQANTARLVNGDIVLDAGPGGEVVAGGQISAQGWEQGAKGGNVTVLVTRSLCYCSRIDASGQAGGGNVLVGGDWKGSGSFQQATSVDMQAGAEIKVNATNAGDGGKVVLWSDVRKEGSETSVAGSIEAMGGVDGGNGGNVETSGHTLNISNTFKANASSAKGETGKWLLDPLNVVIDSSNASAYQTTLNSGTDVTIAASGSPSASIQVNTPLIWTSNILSLQSQGNIYVNADMTAKGAFAGVMLRTGYSTPGVNGGTYDTSKSLIFGVNADGFLGRINIQDSAGAARTGFGFRLNDDNYTLINSMAGLQGINLNAATLTGKYALVGDLDASSYSGFVPLGNSSTQFTGALYGLGHVISGLAINLSSTDYVGLFGYTSNALISSIGLTGSQITARGAVGGLIGMMKDGELKNSYVKTSQISGLGEVGGLVGHVEVSDGSSTTIANNFYTGSVNGTTGGSVGGLIGLVFGANASYGDILIQNNFANVTLTSSSDNVGGGIGNVALYGAVRVNVVGNYSGGSVTGPGGVGGFIGGTDLNGCAWGCRSPGELTVNRNYSTSTVVGSNGVGGFAGALWNGWSNSAFQDNYATGSVTVGSGQTGGAFIGYNQITQSNSYATGSVAGGSTLGGLIGNNWLI